MTRLLLVRHARPAAGFGEELDPGLDDVGTHQARAAADRLEGRGPLAILTSPLRRAVETAAPLAARWGVTPVVEPAVGEIPSPAGGLADRGGWLRELLAARWPEIEAELGEWRERLLATVGALAEETVVFTHFVAISTVVGAATGDDRVVTCSPTHTSLTELEVVGGRLELRATPDSGHPERLDPAG
jgi:broad specificity phosphatase PhoE